MFRCVSRTFGFVGYSVRPFVPRVSTYATAWDVKLILLLNSILEVLRLQTLVVLVYVHLHREHWFSSTVGA